MNYDPVDLALAWTGTNEVIVAHSEQYSASDVYGGTCAGSGIFAVPVNGGAIRPLFVGKKACDATLISDGTAIDPTTAWVVYGVRLPPNNSGLVKAILADGTTDTLATGCLVYLQGPTISRDGRFIAAHGICADRQKERFGTYVIRSDGSELRRIAQGVRMWQTVPTWSPDGNEIAFEGDSAIFIVSTRGGGERRLPAGSWPSWSPDGRWIAFGTGYEVRVVRPDGSEERAVFRNIERGTYTRGWGPMPEGKPLGPIVWSPDSKSLVFSRRYDHGTTLWRLDIAEERLAQLTRPDNR